MAVKNANPSNGTLARKNAYSWDCPILYRLVQTDEDQASSYPSQNYGSDDKAEDEVLNARSSNEDNMQEDIRSIEVDVEWQQVYMALGKDVALIVESDTTVQGELSREERREWHQDLEEV